MTTRTIPAGEFKAKCLKLLDEVAATGEEIVVTKCGRVVARVVAPRRVRDWSHLHGSVLKYEDPLEPAGDPDDWDVGLRSRPDDHMM